MNRIPTFHGRRARRSSRAILALPALLALLSGCEAPQPQPAGGPGDGGPAAAQPAPDAAPPPSVAAPAPAPSASSFAAAAAHPAVPTAVPAASSDVVAGASQRYDPGPSVIASDSIDGAALRKRHVERLKADGSPVTVLRGQGPLELGKRICEAVVPRRPAETPVLLKPNLCGFDSVKDPAKHKGDDGVTGRITQPEFVRGVVQCLKARGHTKITIAEGCGHSHKFWKDLVQRTGYEAMAAEEGAALVAMDDDGVFDVAGDRPGKPLAIRGIEASHVPTLLMPKVLAEHLDRGLFLSLPRLKMHRYSVISAGIKGMQGTVMLSDSAPAYKQKWRMHRELKPYLDTKAAGQEDRALYLSSLRVFAERMVDVLEISTPDAVLGDGAPAMGGDGFQVLRPTAEMVAVGGTNPVRVDRVVAELLGVWNSPALARELGGHRTSPLIDAAAKRFGLDLKTTAITGDGADLLKAPRPVHYKAMAPFRLDWEPGQAPLPGGGPARGSEPAPPPPRAAPGGAPDGGTAAPDGGTAAGPAKPEARAARLAPGERVVLDGKADDPAWGRAKAVQWETDYAGERTGFPTRARFLWSEAGLHALFELSNAGLNTDRSKPVGEERKGLYREDCIELFLTPDPGAPRRYFEVEIGPFGHFFDIAVDRGARLEDTAWSSGATIAARQSAGERTAVIEALLAAPEIVKALAPDARLPMNLYRMEGKEPRRYLAWSPPRTSKPNFHVPEAFGVLVLDP
ncbi:DUF362 domain-containing protein [Sorangium cellulosum]|uniref:DUF362 domain-containing protein n=1 Tax=Sorangium cellulosum So0157-2 TaxID=1254432 RepID=S4XJL8_SORCE|nr:DUF362 domain-containing protein [Sorangium cellulosum]AGP33372.1 hypothetical protein SCE1572_01900 [Sorangium cellulosum So0157-2]